MGPPKPAETALGSELNARDLPENAESVRSERDQKSGKIFAVDLESSSSPYSAESDE